MDVLRMELFKNKYRIGSKRLKGWDYSGAGRYFVTICTGNRVCYFGDVADGKMKLSPIGEIVNDEWYKTEQVRQNVKLDEFVVMPNHLHGIIVITNAVLSYANLNPYAPNGFGRQGLTILPGRIDIMIQLSAMTDHWIASDNILLIIQYNGVGIEIIPIRRQNAPSSKILPGPLPCRQNRTGKSAAIDRKNRIDRSGLFNG